jgi:hypothetical protein
MTDYINNNNSDTNSIYNPYSIISKLSLVKKKHKELNNLLHIYQHKVDHKIMPHQRKTETTGNNKSISNSQSTQYNLHQMSNLGHVKNNSSNKSVLTYNSSLPNVNHSTSSTFKVKNKLLQNNEVSKNSKNNKSYMGIDNKAPKFLLEEEKLKLEKMKEIIKLNKDKKQKEAKEMKESNRLMRENILIFKDKMQEENKQKKKIVDAKYVLMKNSIQNYKIMKKDYIDNNFAEEIEVELNEILKKKKELEKLKMVYDYNVNNLSNKENEISSNKDSNKDKKKKYKHNKTISLNTNSFSTFNKDNKDIKKYITSIRPIMTNKSTDEKENIFMTDIK